MADFIVFRKTGERDDGAPELTGPIGPIVRGLKADDYERAVETVTAPQIGETYIAFRYDMSADVEVEGPPKLTRSRG